MTLELGFRDLVTGFSRAQKRLLLLGVRESHVILLLLLFQRLVIELLALLLFFDFLLDFQVFLSCCSIGLSLLPSFAADDATLPLTVLPQAYLVSEV